MPKATRKTISKILFLLVFLGFLSCSQLTGGESSFTKKLVAQNFVSQLYGTTTKTLTISHAEDSHISWLGFIQSNDYRYFKITKVQAGGKTIESDGQADLSGNVFVPSSNAIIEDITVSASDDTETGVVNGSVSVAGAKDLKITVEYAPLIAVDSETEPHTAYLVIYYDKPEMGSARIELDGFTQGIKADKCTQAAENLDAYNYKFVDGTIDLYFCSKQVAVYDQNNTPQDPSDPDYHGASTNLAKVPMNGSFTMYQADAETACVLSDPPSVEPFDLPIPAGIAPITSMGIEIAEGSYAECAIDSDGGINCPANIQLDTLVAVSGMSLTNGAVAAEDLVTDDCPDFGAISGSGKFGETPLQLVLYGTVLSDQNTEEFQIVNSLVVGVMNLE